LRFGRKTNPNTLRALRVADKLRRLTLRPLISAAAEGEAAPKARLPPVDFVYQRHCRSFAPADKPGAANAGNCARLYLRLKNLSVVYRSKNNLTNRYLSNMKNNAINRAI